MPEFAIRDDALKIFRKREAARCDEFRDTWQQALFAVTSALGEKLTITQPTSPHAEGLSLDYEWMLDGVVVEIVSGHPDMPIDSNYRLYVRPDREGGLEFYRVGNCPICEHPTAMTPRLSHEFMSAWEMLGRSFALGRPVDEHRCVG